MDEQNAETKSAHTTGCFICETAMPLLEKCFPEVTREHFRASKIEFLKGMRTLIDARIAQLSHETETKGTKVPVE